MSVYKSLCKKFICLLLLSITFLSECAKNDLESLWKYLEATQLDMSPDQELLDRYTVAIQKLLDTNKELLATKKKNWLPAQFALYNCCPEISKLFYGPLSCYKKSSEEQKKQALLWASGYGKIVADKIVETMQKCSDGIENKCYKNIGIDEKSDKKFDVFVTYAPQEQEDINFCLNANFIGELQAPAGGGVVGRIYFECRDLCADRLWLYINDLRVEKTGRQAGIGRALLDMVIRVAQMLVKKFECNDAQIRVIAIPEKTEMLPVLIDFYKLAGFVPENSSGALSMYINKQGDILKKNSFIKGWEWDWAFQEDHYREKIIK